MDHSTLTTKRNATLVSGAPYPDNVPGLVPYGIGTGHHGHTGACPAQILVCARSNPVFGPVEDLTGHSGHALSNPVRGQAGAAIWVTRTLGLESLVIQRYVGYYLGSLSVKFCLSGMPIRVSQEKKYLI